MNDSIQNSDNKVSARRRLIRGAFATPAMFTLYSGSALAQTTSRLACIVKANIAPTPAPVVDTTNSTFKRVQLRQEGGLNYVYGSDLPGARVAALPSISQRQQFDIPMNKLVGPLGPNSPAGTLVFQYAVIRVNSSGVIVDVGNTSTAVGSAIGNSCWTSFITP